MLFNSFDFLIFFTVVVFFYFSIPQKYRWAFLLAASYFFYGYWHVGLLKLIITSTLVAYTTGLAIDRSKNQNRKKIFLSVSLVANLGLLFLYKYFNFFSSSLNVISDYIQLPHTFPMKDMVLPIGISFYTFQTLSYTIDVYRGDKKAEKHLGIFALYVSFFPQLVAGPIERSTNLLPQLFKKTHFDYKRVTDGLKLMLWGFFKKVVIADRLAIYVNAVYNNPDAYTGIPVILATYFFAFQIYCDFSGYSDIAIGAAKVMGYELTANFKRPYYSKSIREFWRRWHITLTTWFKDYLYISIGGNRVSKWRWYGNIFLVFLVSGLWHGANWTFVLWGALHGFYMLFSIWTAGARHMLCERSGLINYPNMHRYIKIFITFHLALFAWVFFRSSNFSDALTILRSMFDFRNGFLQVDAPMGWYELGAAFVSIFIMESVHFLQRRRSMREFMSDRPIWLRWTVYYILMFYILLFGVFTEQQFIYFQF